MDVSSTNQLLSHGITWYLKYEFKQDIVEHPRLTDTETDQLQNWMKSNGVWHKMLYNILSEEEVETLDEFKSLPLLDVIYIIDDAKEAGFAEETKLKSLHGGFRDENSKRESIVPNQLPIQPELKTDPSIENKNSNTELNKENISENVQPPKNIKKQKSKPKKPKSNEHNENKSKNQKNNQKTSSESKNQKSNAHIENKTKPIKTKKKKSNKSKTKYLLPMEI